MNFTDERLARLKHATRMAVTRQDAAPAWGPALPGAPLTPPRPILPAPALPMPGPPSAPATTLPVPGRIRRVPARLIALPAAALPTPGWYDPTWPGAAPAEATGPEQTGPEQIWPGQTRAEQAGLTPGAPTHLAPQVAPAAVQPGPAPLDATAPVSVQPTGQAPAAWDPTGMAGFTPAPVDPYGDHAALLAAGLSETPPPGLPPLGADQPLRAMPGLSAATSPAVPRDLEARPLRAASFMEALALNAEASSVDAPQPAPPAAPVPPLPEAVADAHPAPVQPVAAQTIPAQPIQAQTTPVAGMPSQPPLGSAAGHAPVPPRPAAEPLRSEDQRAAPADAGRTALPPGEAAEAGPQVARPVAEQEPGVPTTTASPLTDDAPQAIRAAVPTPEPTLTSPAVEVPAADRASETRSPDPIAAQPVAADADAADARTADAGTADHRAESPAPSSSAADEAQAAEQLQAQRDAQARERQELEALMRGGNNDIPVRLPRRPRPVPLRAPAPPPEPEAVKVAPPIPTDVSQNILARLNRFAELEAAGETDESAIPFGQLENWQDHHPERNVTPTAAPAESPSPAPTPRLDPAPPASGGATRVRARSRQGREPQAARQSPADSDEEPERGPRPGTAPDALIPSDAAVRPDSAPLPVGTDTAVPAPAELAPPTTPSDTPGAQPTDHKVNHTEDNRAEVAHAMSRATAPVQTTVPEQSTVPVQTPPPVPTTRLARTPGAHPEAPPSPLLQAQPDPAGPAADLPETLPAPSVALPEVQPSAGQIKPTWADPAPTAPPVVDVVTSPDPASPATPVPPPGEPVSEASVPTADAPGPVLRADGDPSWPPGGPALPDARLHTQPDADPADGEKRHPSTPVTGQAASVMARAVAAQPGPSMPTLQPDRGAALTPDRPVEAPLAAGGLDVQATVDRSPPMERTGPPRPSRAVYARNVQAPIQAGPLGVPRPVAAPTRPPLMTPAQTTPTPTTAEPVPAMRAAPGDAPERAGVPPVAPSPRRAPVRSATPGRQAGRPEPTTRLPDTPLDAGTSLVWPTVLATPAGGPAPTDATARAAAAWDATAPFTGTDDGATPAVVPAGLHADSRAVTAPPIPAGWRAPGPGRPTGPTGSTPRPDADAISTSRPGGAVVPPPAPGVLAPVLPGPVPEGSARMPGPLSAPGSWGAALQRAALPAPLLPMPAQATLPPVVAFPAPPFAWLPEPGRPVAAPVPAALTPIRANRPMPATVTPTAPTIPPGALPVPSAAPVPHLAVPPLGEVRADRPDAVDWPSAPAPRPAEAPSPDRTPPVPGPLPRAQATRAAGVTDAPPAWSAEPADRGARMQPATDAGETRLEPVRPPRTGSEDRSAPGPLDAPLSAAPGPQLLKAAPTPGRTRTGTDQAVLAALEHALARDGHGTPLSPGEQDALRGVLGTSVADVRVVRRPEVTPALRAARADGLTVGETVFLPHDVPLGSAAGLALAAHEVTHARRARDPLFVPAALTRPTQPPRPDASPRPGRPAAVDEEGVALATEHAAFAQADPARQSRVDAPRRAPGLPAPWEPLPAWDAPDPAARPSVSADAWAPAVPSAPAPVQSVSAALPAAPPPATTPLWHAAATDRAPAPAAKPARPPEDQAVGRRAQPRSSVDLDQVAREVYARLRERLSQELRRLN
ncbi:eCIS core domain-containing protein [Deinococcus sp. RM]|uniref:eCIS core domain-containing protein n=1 Tax=Deinococcus sp. RM TaxID=2316359 RepID=UPI003AB1B1A7